MPSPDDPPRLASPPLTNDHWVSRGYQNNFAEDKRVAIIDVETTRVVDLGRPTKSNFAERGFTTYLDEGQRNEQLERAFATVERTALNQIREVTSTDRGPERKAAVANLAAVHLVRSPAYKTFHQVVIDGFRTEGVPQQASDPKLVDLFEKDFGRPPNNGDLLALTHGTFNAIDVHPQTVRTSMARQHDKAADILNRFFMQVIEVDAGLPGLALGDTPIVHAAPAMGRYGFRDRLALLDATVIYAPLSRRVGVCFSARPLSPFKITTRANLERLNALTLRAATREVACHPEDARSLRQTCQRLDRLDPSRLLN